MNSKLSLVGAVIGCLALGAVALPADARGNSTSAKKCQKGGWQTLKTDTGEAFADEAACVSYAAQGGGLFRPLLVAEPSEVVEDQGFDLTASGFHPSDNSEVKVESLGTSGSITLFALTNANGGSKFTGVFTAGACAAGTTGALYTFTDSHGLTDSVTVTLNCN